MITDLHNIVIEYLMISKRHVQLNKFYLLCDLNLELSKFDYLKCVCPNNLCLNCIENDFFIYD